MTETFIRTFEGPWHLSTIHEMRGDKTGEVIHRFVVTACRGQQIGLPWGHTTWRHEHRPDRICKNCQKLLNHRRAQ